ncbi:hypothetical protein PHSY_002132 [Pseudozyma hubeiensis SY62]|uniref:HhH-GPD domain-containing protein n=1 Tax=Pseudozyma hubeiensis (strain SY62) TaxID=1305764 RepID=R9P0D9_PSEHS|nr:hypothetical protein PHSY_002132 [Pseudozyma hubeiensis SY62]GAC94559.1 hypothetical protein PHSY_002132 [Pseudozyma hubeiensis SY62]
MKKRSPQQPVRRSTRILQRTSPYFSSKDVEPEGSTSHARPIKIATGSDEAHLERSAARKGRGSRSKRRTGCKIEQANDPPLLPEVERVHGLARQANFYGLIQEIVTPNVFRLLVATCLLNQTKGRAAMPVFWELLKRWPDEHSLARANIVELTDLLQPIGLHNIRARRLVSMAQTMVEIPYNESNLFKSRDRTAPDSPIGIYPGVGRYAIDSWRIFVAGGGASVGLRGAKPVSPFDTVSVEAEASGTQLAPALPSMSRNVEAMEAEWKTVMPLDKELRAYLVWRWAKEGKVWDPVRGVASTSRGSH